MMFTPYRPALNLIALCLAIAVQGCAHVPNNSLDSVGSVILAKSQPASEIDSLKQGDTANFRTGLLAPLGLVTIGREYHSASGRLCKRILNESGDQLLAVTCRASEGQWYMRQRS